MGWHSVPPLQAPVLSSTQKQPCKLHCLGAKLPSAIHTGRRISRTPLAMRDLASSSCCWHLVFSAKKKKQTTCKTKVSKGTPVLLTSPAVNQLSRWWSVTSPFLFIEYFFSLFSHFTKIMKKSLRSYKCSAFLLGRGQSFSSNVDGKANVFFFNSSSSLRNSTTSDVKVWFIYLVVLNCVHLPVAEFYLISFFYCWSSDLLKITIWNRTTRNIKCHFF